MKHLAQDPLVNFTELEGGIPGFKFKDATIGTIVASLVPYVFVLAGVLLLFYIAIAGYSMMVSQGDPKAMASAKAKLTNGLIGFFTVFSAYWIVQAIALMLGLSQITNIFK